MKHRRGQLALLAAAILLLTGCSTPSEDGGAPVTGGSQGPSAADETQPPRAEPVDLTGEWKQINSNSPDSYQAAVITEDQIAIDWVNEADSSRAIYWVGTFVGPDQATESDTFAWDSFADTAQMQNALLASGEPMKTFTYHGGQLTYELTAMGVTMTVEMTRQ